MGILQSSGRSGRQAPVGLIRAWDGVSATCRRRRSEMLTWPASVFWFGLISMCHCGTAEFLTILAFSALPTIEYLRGEGAKVILVSHLGRPDGREDPALRLDPVVRRLSDLLGVPVRKTAALVGLEVTEAVGALRPEGVLVLENSRFHPGETQNDQTLSKQLADLADVFVNDAFGAAHRAHATTAGVAEY